MSYQKTRQQELADRQHDLQREYAVEHLKAAWTFAGEFYKLTGTAAVGSIAAMVAWLATKPDEDIRDALLTAVPIFATGLVLLLVSAGLGYIAQCLYAEWHRDVKLIEDHPYVQHNKPWAKALGECVRWLAILAAVLCVALIVYGLWHVLDVLKPWPR